MRVIIIGKSLERRRLREALEHTALDIVAEFTSRVEAREAAVSADAIFEVLGDPDPVDEVAEALQEHLTAREIEVLELIAEGLSNKAIATRLGISDQTVKFHASSIQGKLGAANRTDAVRRAVRRGLVTL